MRFHPRIWLWLFLFLCAARATAAAEDLQSIVSTIKSNEAQLRRFEAQRSRLAAEGEAAKAAELDARIAFLRAENERNHERIERLREKIESPEPEPPAEPPKSEPAPETADDFTGKDWTMMPPDRKASYASEALGGLKDLGVPIEKDAAYYVAALDEWLSFDPSFEGAALGDVFLAVIGEKEPKTRPAIEGLRRKS